jgi:hypothetical protein
MLAVLVVPNVPILSERAPATFDKAATQSTGAVFTLEAFNPGQVDEILGPDLPYVSAGDTIDLGAHFLNNTPDIPVLNAWANQLHAALPSGVNLTARVESLANVRLAAEGLSPYFSGIAVDYEPDTSFFPNWTWNFSTALSYYENATAICHSYGRLAIAYPTGRPLNESDLEPYHWDYARIAAVVDAEKIETQSWAAPSDWAIATAKLVSEFAQDDVSLARLTVQITVGLAGHDVNVVNASDAISDIDLALDRSIDGIYLWGETGAANRSALLEVLQTFVAPLWPVDITASGLPAGERWWLNLTDGPSFSTDSSTFRIFEANGSHAYSVTTSDKRYSASEGFFVVAGSERAVSISFLPVTFLVSFQEAGLPNGIGWGVTISGANLSTDSADLSIPLANGTYSYRIHDVAGWHEATLPYSGTVTLAGGGVRLPELDFHRVVYDVTIAQNDLPPGSEWWVNFTGGASYPSTTGTLEFSEPNGTYTFTAVCRTRAFEANSTGGSFVVDGTNVEATLFFEYAYFVTFSERGLPNGTSWTLHVNGSLSETITSPSVEVLLPNGTYSYTAEADGFQASGGEFIVAGPGSVAVVVTFRSPPPPVTGPGTPSTGSSSAASPSPSLLESIEIGSGVILASALVSYLLVRRRSGGPPRS